MYTFSLYICILYTYICMYIYVYVLANYSDLSRGHPTRWFSKGESSQNSLNSSLGIIVICPDMCTYIHLCVFHIHLYNLGNVTSSSPCNKRYADMTGNSQELERGIVLGEKYPVPMIVSCFSL